MTHRPRGEGWHLWSERSVSGVRQLPVGEPAGMEQVSLERAAVLGNPPQEWVLEGRLLTLIPSRKECDADMDSQPGLCFSHC